MKKSWIRQIIRSQPYLLGSVTSQAVSRQNHMVWADPSLPVTSYTPASDTTWRRSPSAASRVCVAEHELPPCIDTSWSTSIDGSGSNDPTPMIPHRCWRSWNPRVVSAPLETTGSLGALKVNRIPKSQHKMVITRPTHPPIQTFVFWKPITGWTLKS